MKKKSFILAVLPFVFTGLALAAIPAKDAAGPAKETEVNRDILRFNSKEEILQILKDFQRNTRGSVKYEAGLPAGSNEFIAAENASTAVADSAQAKTDHSTTNVQVQGVDEADLVKTDGEFIYHLREKELVISKAYPVESFSVSSQTRFGEDFYPREMFVDGKTVTVLGYRHNLRNMQPESGQVDAIFPPHNTGISVLVYDARDKQNLRLLRQVDLQGDYVSSRKIGDTLYLATNQYVYLQRGPDFPLQEEFYLPMYRDTARSGDFSAVDVKDIYHFPDDPSNQFLNVAAIDLSDSGSPVKISSYMGGGNQMYMSETNLYIAKANRVSRKAVDKAWNPATTIYKFSVSGNGLVFKGKGEVPGTLLNQFSMDEHKGYFRVATTKQMGSDKSENNLYILDGDMSVIGKVEGLARGERIYSVRFMGDRGYVVTFKNVDPLYSLDLKNPKEPKVMGELKIPGFSSYLHPYDENHVIGFGRDTEEKTLSDGRTVAVQKGIKLSLFDVSDMRNPQEMFTTVIGDASLQSPLQYDHKALLFSKEKQLFAFPVVQYDSVKQPFAGFYVYGIDLKKGFVLKGILSQNGQQNYGFRTQRMLYIGNTLYSISDEIYKFYDLNTLREIRPPVEW